MSQTMGWSHTVKLCRRYFSRRAAFFTTANASGKISSSFFHCSSSSGILDTSSFHAAVFARNSSSDKLLNCSSSSLIRCTIGIRRLSSRWFFEPKIFFKIQPTISRVISTTSGDLSFASPPLSFRAKSRNLSLLDSGLQPTIGRMKKVVSTGDAPQAIGAYSQAVRSGRFLFCSGQIPLDPKSDQIVSGDIAAQTRRVLDNIAAVLRAEGLGFENIVKTTIFLTDLSHFQTVDET